MNYSCKDRIYSNKIEKPGDFVFDQKVVEVFPDMLQRSIPGYQSIIKMIATLTSRFAQPNSNLYDLGCSLGAATEAMVSGLQSTPATVKAIDNSQAMIKRCHELEFTKPQQIQTKFICADIIDYPISNASVVVMNFTLQFIDRAKRSDLLTRIWQGMLPNGILILSEKVQFEDQSVNELLIDVYHAFKRANGYSDLEISQKRSALEKVLLPETIKQHRDRLIRSGFSSADVWFQSFNFMSMLAIK